MFGTEVRARGAEIPAPPSSEWLLAAAGDFNRDLMPDILWFDRSAAQLTTTRMIGTGLLEQGPTISDPTEGDWIVGNVADCNGDGMSDLIWLGIRPLRMRVWLMNGGVPVGYGPVIRGPAGR